MLVQVSIYQGSIWVPNFDPKPFNFKPLEVDFQSVEQNTHKKKHVQQGWIP